jgi:integrase
VNGRDEVEACVIAAGGRAMLFTGRWDATAGDVVGGVEPPARPDLEPARHVTCNAPAEIVASGSARSTAPGAGDAVRILGPRSKPSEAMAWARERTTESELTLHLLPFFARHRLSQITVQEVDRYRQSKVREGESRRAAIKAGKPLRDRDGQVLRPLGATSINKTISRLGQILEDAVEYDLIPRNPARGKRRRLKAPKNTRSHIDRADHVVALLVAASELDRDARADRRHIARRAIVATLVFGGLRISELCSLRWRQIDVAAGRIRVGESKTEAGLRHVDMLPALRDELLAWKSRATRTGPRDFVFGTSAGKRPSKDNLRRRVIGAAIVRANVSLEADGLAPLPDRLTPHGLRHTYSSILIARGEKPAVRDGADRPHRSRVHAAPVHARDAARGRRGAAPPRSRGRRRMGTTSGASSDAPGRIRTCDLALRRRALYPLSYGR